MKFNSKVPRELLMWFSAFILSGCAITGFYLNIGKPGNSAIYSMLFFGVLAVLSLSVALFLRTRNERYMKVVYFISSPINSISSFLSGKGKR